MITNQHIQHLWCCAIVGAMFPPVIPAAIRIQVLRTWRYVGRYCHYVALISKISPRWGARMVDVCKRQRSIR